ncbi:MAG: hypothetical protein VCA73_00230 [Roseibacillus sp.]
MIALGFSATNRLFDPASGNELHSRFLPGDLVALPLHLGLPSAERDARIYATTIATLSVMTQALRDTILPQPSVADIVVALAEDLASGNLDGRDSGGARVEIGASGVFLPDYTDQDLADALSQLKGKLNGLGNVFLQAPGGGQFVASRPRRVGSVLLGERRVGVDLHQGPEIKGFRSGRPPGDR